MSSAGFEVYKQYMAIKLHFTSESYDFFKYNAKTRVDTFDHYLKRKDRFFFEKLSRKHPNEIQEFLVSQFIANGSWIGDMLNEESEKTYFNWKKNNEALQYNFKTDLNYIQSRCETLENAVDPRGLTHPMLLQFLLGKKVSLETVIICNACRKFIPTWTKHMPNDPIYKKKLLLMKKYRPFMKFEVDTFTKIVDNILPIMVAQDEISLYNSNIMNVSE